MHYVCVKKKKKYMKKFHPWVFSCTIDRYLNGEKISIKDEFEVDGVERIVVACPMGVFLPSRSSFVDNTAFNVYIIYIYVQPS